MNRFFLKMFCFALLIISLTISSFSYHLSDLKEVIFPDQAPFIDENNRTLVPLRFLSENLGGKVLWNGSNKTVNINYKGEEIELKVGSKDVMKTNKGIKKVYNMGTSSVIAEGRVMVPLRFLSEAMEAEVLWEDRIKSIVINREMIINLNIKKGSNYNFYDDFNYFNNAQWMKTDHFLEGTKINSKNVFIDDGKLKILLPKGVLEGGEIQSRKPLGFGTYEIRMKLPNAPSSITGFFLYKAPSLYNEIDIEIYNEKSKGYFLTTYAAGEKKNFFEGKLGFDPTIDFHNYKIEYYEDSLKFYIDNILLKEWKDGYSKEDMFLIVNTWYPDWLEKKPGVENTFLEIDWIKY